MIRNVLFTPEAFADYQYWQTQDRKTLKRINALLIDVMRNGTGEGIGKPERLRDWPDTWSRRIDDKNRLIYSANDEVVTIYACRTHYGDK